MISIKYSLKKYTFCAKKPNVNSTLHIGHAKLCDLSTRQHIFDWTRSVTVEQPQPYSGLLQDIGCHPLPSLSFHVNGLN